ncbi:hypothetical protein ASPWEDRAFT_171008 [Aspergillus wentii DTO 134E9]|uniref:RNA polymerase III RPC4-domain-containing protein n=1 Tax=Aspergillus wentii DTO 134E9 TaxID=1073089 RepID=A0A1L9RRJ3_ASPWE|nr:uncharacterized protein ASPWEDRAFT_171008 [Aspergillus wentii DTO 134E9]OJJ37539.1 hypothetical protein ASPWEDRAFT_171008 [Aspergillus wentii DTO 134E9]
MPPKAAPRRGGAAAPRRTDSTQSGSSASPNPSESRSTPTPGPSGSRPPVQRLQSLNKRTPTGSIPAKPSPLGNGGNGEPAKPTLKYKPRAVGRRSKEEREAIEKLEAERHRERLKEAAAIQRGRGGGPAGRGGRGRGGGPGGANGPFGAGRRGRGGRFGEGDSRASSMSRRSRSVIDMGSGAAPQDYSSDESDSGIRVSIDYINLESDDEEFDDMVDKKKGKIPARNVRREKGLRPIRVERVPHEERAVSVNMESSSSKSADIRQEAQDKAQEKADDDALFVQQDDDSKTTEPEPRVKEEPTDDGDQVMTDAIPHADEAAATDDELLPAQKVKVRRNLSPRQQEREQREQEEREQAQAQAPVAAKDPRSLLRTREEIEEFERHEQDLEAIKKLLIVEQKEEEKPAEPKKTPPDAPETTTEDQQDKPDEKVEKKEEGAEEEEKEETAEDKLAGQLFLVQFPPMTPNLIVPGTGVAEDEETTQNAGEPGASGEETAVKHEDGDVEVLDGGVETTPKARKVVTASDWQLSAGRAGKLNVHASGRLTMDWGGISFELDRAATVNFLQEALVMSTPNASPEEYEENRVWAMGQLSGKFTVTPDWAKML